MKETIKKVINKTLNYLNPYKYLLLATIILLTVQYCSNRSEVNNLKRQVKKERIECIKQIKILQANHQKEIEQIEQITEDHKIIEKQRRQAIQLDLIKLEQKKIKIEQDLQQNQQKIIETLKEYGIEMVN